MISEHVNLAAGINYFHYSFVNCQLSRSQSLRDTVDGYNSQQARHYHLGTDTICRSSLADANQKRPVKIYQETFYYLLEKVRGSLPKSEVNSMVRLIDSTTIDLNINQFKWANFRSKKAGIKLHTVYDPSAEMPVYFEMTHAKVNDRKALSNLHILKGGVFQGSWHSFLKFYAISRAS